MGRKQMRGGETGRGEEGKRWGLGTSRRMNMECPWNDGNAQAHPLYDGNDGGDESRVMRLVDGGRAIY